MSSKRNLAAGVAALGVAVGFPGAVQGQQRYAKLRLRVNEDKSAVARVGPQVPGLQLLGSHRGRGPTPR